MFAKTMDGASVEAQRYATNIKNGTGSASTFATNQRAIQSSMYETSIVSKAAAVGLNIFKAALNSLIFFAVIEGIQLLIKGIDNLILTAEEAEEKAETLRSNMQSFFDDVQSGQQTISSISDRFSELSEHVTKTGENIDLTKDEYSEYLDICNQVKDIMPELVTGYTNEGNAIITLKDNVDSLTESYKENIKAKAASFVTNGDDDGNTIQSFFDDYDIFTNGENGLFAPSVGGLWNNKSTDFEDYYGYNKIHDWLSDVSEMSLKDLQNLQSGTTEATYLCALLKENGYELTDITEDNYNAIHDVLTTRLTSLEGEMTTRVSNIKMSLQQMLYADSDYWNIDDKEALSALDSLFASIDDEFIKQNNLFSQTALQSFESNAIDLFQNNSTKQSMIDIFAPQGENESIKDYTTRVKNAISEIQKYCNVNGITVPFNFGTEDDPKGVQESVDKLQEKYDATINRFKSDASDSSSKELSSLNKQLDEQTQNLTYAKENLQNEYDKISDWGLDDYADQIKNNTIQTKFGNVDMDKRTIIHWSDELKQTYADALASWDYDPEVGSIDTVFGGSERFGEELNGNGWEVAFTPILPDGTFLSKDTVEEYINSILEEAYADDGKVTEDELTAIDAQGRQVGDTFVQGIFAGIDDSQNYDDNGNWAETVGRLMHFTGKFGAKQIADHEVNDANTKIEETKKKIEEVSKGFDDSDKIKDFFDTEGINTDAEIDEFNKVTEGITRADDAIQKWNEHKKEGNEIGVSNISSAWEQLKSSTEDATKGVADALTTLADKGELTVKTFMATSGANNYFTQLGYSAQEAVDYINKLSDKNSQLGAMSKNIQSITKALGTKASDGIVSVDDLSGFDATIKGLNTWEKFSTILGDASSSMKDCQEVANELATEYVNSEAVLSNLNETNRDYYESQLDNMGVTNSTAVVEAALAKNLGEEKIATEEAIKAGLSLHGVKIDTTNATDLFSNATASEIIQLANEANQTGTSSQALALLAVKKMNNPTLTTDGDIKNLMALCKGLDLAAQAIETFQSIKNNVMNPDGSIKATSSAEKIAKENALNNAYNSMKSIITTSVSSANVNSSGGSSGGSGGGGGSSTKTQTPFDKLSDWASQFFDWIEVRLDRLQSKIDSNISKAESKLNDKRYSSATANYMSAINVTYDKINDTKAGRDEYIKYANNYINKAISLKAINKNLAEEIKSRVADGSINISEYSSDVQTVISTYKDWIDKAKDCTTAMQTLHDSLRTYAEDLKKVSDAQRDAIVSMVETKQTIATGGVQNTSTAKNSALNYNNLVLDTKNKAYSTATKSATKNVNKLAGSANYGINTAKKGSKKYNTTLSNIKGYIKKRVAIPNSLLAIVAKHNSTLYNRLYMYNLGIENLQTAREEYTTAFAANNAERYNNIAEEYKNLDDTTNDAIDLLGTKSSNSVYAKNKNKYLNNQKSGYKNIVNRDVAERNKYSKLVRSAKRSMKSSKGTSFSALSKKNQKSVLKYVQTAKNYAKKNRNIPDSIIGKLSEYVKKGYVSSSFLNACINYNNALESYNQAKAQTEIDKQTQITQRAEIASQKFSNLATEYDNKRHTYEQGETELNSKMSYLEEKGRGASSAWYSRLKSNEEKQNKALVSKRTALINSLNNSVKTGDIKKYSTEWYDLRSQIDDVTNAIDESTKALAEYDNQMLQVHWDRIDERANKVQNLIDENNFVIDELSRRNLASDETGGLTNEGNAVAGLHLANYKAYVANANAYYSEIQSINKKLAKDPYNEKLIEQKEKLVKSYQDATKAAQDERSSVISLIENGYTALSNKIKNLISDYEDLLDKQSDAYNYSESINEKTKTLSDLRKQLAAYSGDDSEESRAKVQELNKSYKDAQKDLKDTQYDKLISSTKDMLSDFQDNLDENINKIVDNLDNHFDAIAKTINTGWSKSNDAIDNVLKTINYHATKQFNKESANGSVTKNTETAVQSIYNFLKKAWESYDYIAKSSHTTGESGGGNKTLTSQVDTSGKGKGKDNDDLTKTPQARQIQTFIADNATKKTISNIKTLSALDQILYKNYKKYLTVAKWKELAKKLGLTYSTSKSSALYKAIHNAGIKGFKKGSDGIPYDMIANLGENGTELQYDVSKGVLKSVGQGDMIFTAEQAKTLMEFAKNPMAYKNMYTGTAFSMPSVPVNNNTNNDVNITIGDINLDNVQNPVEFANAMKDVIKNNTGNVRNMIREDTVGSLSKNYNSQKIKRW